MAHLTSFTVENFKRFEHFEMNNIGQFNLIVGDNNVGKTSVLEALLVDENSAKMRYSLLKVLTEYRGIEKLRESFWRSFVRWAAWMKLPTTFFAPEFGEVVFTPDDGDYFSNYSPEESMLGENVGYGNVFDISNDKTLRFNGTLRYDGTGLVHVPYLPLFLGYSRDIAVVYSSYIQESKQNKQIIMKALETLIPDIENIEINVAMAEEPTIVVWQKGNDFPAPLATFGDGTIKLFRILLNLFIHAKKRLMIDEIEAGIHFGRMQVFFKIILQTAFENNIQLFMTTHSRECLEIFKKVLEEPEMVQYQEKARCFTLIESKVTQRVEAVCSTFAEFENAIETKTEIRGGAVA